MKCDRIPVLVTETAVAESVLLYILISTHTLKVSRCKNLMLNCFFGPFSSRDYCTDLPPRDANMALGNQVVLTLYPTNLGYLEQHHQEKSIPVTSCYLILNFIKHLSSGVS